MSGPNQYDIPSYGLNNDSRNVPRYLPGILTSLNFIHFNWPCEMNKYVDRYTVVIESLDNSGPTYKSVSKMKKSVEIPNVHLDWHARIGLVPDAKPGPRHGQLLPVFEAELSRGSTYVIPEERWNDDYMVHGFGRIQMEQHGMVRPPGI